MFFSLLTTESNKCTYQTVYRPIVLCHGLLVEVAGNEVGQQRHGGPHSKKTLWTEELVGTASGRWLQTGTDGELLLPIVLTRTGGSKC